MQPEEDPVFEAWAPCQFPLHQRGDLPHNNLSGYTHNTHSQFKSTVPTKTPEERWTPNHNLLTND